MPFALALGIFAPAGDMSALVRFTRPTIASPLPAAILISVGSSGLSTVISWPWTDHICLASASVKRTDAMPLAVPLAIPKAVRSLVRFTMPAMAASLVISMTSGPSPVSVVISMRPATCHASLASSSVNIDDAMPFATPLAMCWVCPASSHNASRSWVRFTNPTTAFPPCAPLRRISIGKSMKSTVTMPASSHTCRADSSR